MGYMAHNAIIVTGWDPKRVEAARAKALEIFDARQVTNIVTGVVNSYDSFLVGPDGSKEGWPDSKKGDENRAAFLAVLRAMFDGGDFIEWVEMRYGGDEKQYASVTDNGLPPLADEDGDPKFTLPTSGNAPALG